MKRVAIIQARMGSSRLPGKVLMPILGRPMLQLLVERVERASQLDGIIVATTDLPADDVIAIAVEKLAGVDVCRGSESNVLERYVFAARQVSADAVLRVTADNPFFDWEIADALMTRLLSGGHDYVANNLQRSFPYGIDLEAFKVATLEQAYREACDNGELEHVTPYIRNHPELFRQDGLSWETDISSLRLTVDTLEDYRRAVTIFEQFGENVTFREIANAYPL